MSAERPSVTVVGGGPGRLRGGPATGAAGCAVHSGRDASGGAGRRPTAPPGWLRSSCSNSLKSTADSTASGVFKAELDLCGCRLLAAARSVAVPAGAALAVDRTAFSATVEERLVAEPLITVQRGEVTALESRPEHIWLVATGPLTAPALSAELGQSHRPGRSAFLRCHRAHGHPRVARRDAALRSRPLRSRTGRLSERGPWMKRRTGSSGAT